MYQAELWQAHRELKERVDVQDLQIDLLTNIVKTQNETISLIQQQIYVVSEPNEFDGLFQFKVK